MQEKAFLPRKAAAAAALCIVLLLMAQQVCSGPLVPRVRSSPDLGTDPSGVGVLRRTARMTPLWRTMNSKPFGAYCQKHYECSTGVCRAGRCSPSHRSPPETVNY